jgi:hypothetical protein
MVGLSKSLRVIAEAARSAAARVLGDPSLYSVLVDLRETKSAQRPVKLRFGFQRLRRWPIVGDRLKDCWVDVVLDPYSVGIGSIGNYGRRQFKQLANIQGIEFPAPRMDLDSLRIEPVGVLSILKNKPLEVGAGYGRVDLGLTHYEGHLAWRVLQEVHKVGFRTLFLHAGDGHVLFEKVDLWCEPDSSIRGDA